MLCPPGPWKLLPSGKLSRPPEFHRQDCLSHWWLVISLSPSLGLSLPSEGVAGRAPEWEFSLLIVPWSWQPASMTPITGVVWTVYWEPRVIGQVEHSESETMWKLTILNAGMTFRMFQISHMQFEHVKSKWYEQQDNDLAWNKCHWGKFAISSAGLHIPNVSSELWNPGTPFCWLYLELITQSKGGFCYPDVHSHTKSFHHTSYLWPQHRNILIPTTREGGYAHSCFCVMLSGNQNSQSQVVLNIQASVEKPAAVLLIPRRTV